MRRLGVDVDAVENCRCGIGGTGGIGGNVAVLGVCGLFLRPGRNALRLDNLDCGCGLGASDVLSGGGLAALPLFPSCCDRA